MGKMQISISDDVETPFRQSFSGLKKGDLSKKIEELIKKSLNQEAKEIEKEMKLLTKFSVDFGKMILKFYNSEEFSMLAANRVALEWDKLKQKYKIK